MVFGSIKNSELYFPLSGRISRALKFLRETDLTKMPEGRHDIEGDKIFALINNYTTKNADGAYPEAHSIYTDIQFVVEGSELIGFAPYNNQRIQTGYNKEKDIVFYDAPVSFCRLEAGMFMILFPGELHMPGISAEREEGVKKVVIKVLLEK